MTRGAKWALGAVAAVALAAPADAHAAWLSKPRAKAKTAQVARNMFTNIDWAADYTVVSADECGRRSPAIVECDYTLYDEDGVACTSTVRNRLTRYGIAISFPYKPYCE